MILYIQIGQRGREGGEQKAGSTVRIPIERTDYHRDTVEVPGSL